MWWLLLPLAMLGGPGTLGFLAGCVVQRRLDRRRERRIASRMQAQIRQRLHEHCRSPLLAAPPDDDAPFARGKA